MELYTFSGEAPGAIEVGERYLVKVEYGAEEVAAFSTEAEGYSIIDRYFHDDGDGFIDQGEDTLGITTDSFVIEDHRLVGFYLSHDWSPLRIRCVLMRDGSVIGKAEAEDYYPEAIESSVHLAHKHRKFSLVIPKGK